MIKKLSKRNEGQALVIIAILLPVLLGFAALAIDFGLAANTKKDLQQAADAAALAACQELPSIASATSTAYYYAEENGVDSEHTTVTTPYDGDTSKIEVVCKETIQYTFARILGFEEKEISARAVSQYGIAASVPWIVPFVIPEPVAFNYDNIYVMRMYGAGPYPDGYRYPSDFTNDPDYRAYNQTVTTYSYKTRYSRTSLYANASTSSRVNGSIYRSNSTVTFLEETTVSGTLWYKVQYNSISGWTKASNISKTAAGTVTTNTYPYQFDYMNVKIKAGSNPSAEFNQYLQYLESGYHETYSVDQAMLYYAPSSGGPQSVDTFARRIAADPNTDYTKAQVGDPRVMLIPVVSTLLPRNTRENTEVTIIGFAAFYLEAVHKNSYYESFWFEGRFLEDLYIGVGTVTVDPDADFGLRVVGLIE